MYLVMWTHVHDYDDWKAEFDTGEPLRREFGCTGHEIFRDVDDSNQLTLFLDFPSRERAKSFLEDPRLKQNMDRAGIDEPPRTMLVSQTQQVDYRHRRVA